MSGKAYEMRAVGNDNTIVVKFSGLTTRELSEIVTKGEGRGLRVVEYDDHRMRITFRRPKSLSAENFVTIVNEVAQSATSD